MIKHIVIWRLLEQAEGNDKTTNATLIREKLEALNGIIPGLIRLEVGIDFLRSDFSGDLALYAELESRDALTAYQQHPAHVEVAQFIMAVCKERHVVDYGIEAD